MTNLRYFRLFYQAFNDRAPEIHHSTSDELRSLTQEAVLDDLATALEKTSQRKGFSPNLSWTHYRALSKIDQRAERLFYEIETEKAGWSVTVLERQIHSFLFARLLKSRDKAGVLALADQGQTVRQPIDVIKQPYVLDFLNLPDQKQLHESDIESAIIENLQPFLLELGKGFAFVARQYRVAAQFSAVGTPEPEDGWHDEALHDKRNAKTRWKDAVRLEKNSRNSRSPARITSLILGTSTSLQS